MTYELRSADPEPDGLRIVVHAIAPGTRVTGWQVLPGGVDSAMHRIDVESPSGETSAFVLRRPITELGYETDVAHLAATLEALAPTPVAAPEFLWVDPGDAFGRPALAMTLLPGRSRSVDAIHDPEVVRAFAQACASLRAVTDVASFAHLDRYPDAESLLARLVARPLPDLPFADAAAVRNTLVRTVPDLTPFEVGLCHGDLHIGNVLFDGTRATGIVDWDGARLTDPRSDLAYAAMDLALYAGFDVADAFIDAYEAECGPTDDLAWWCLQASTTAWYDVVEWIPGWNEVGIDLDVPTLYERLRRWTDRHLDALR